MAKANFNNTQEQILKNLHVVYNEIDKNQKQLLNEIEKRKNKFMKDEDITSNIELSKTNNADYKLIKELASAKIELLKIQTNINLKTVHEVEKDSDFSQDEMLKIVDNLKKKD